MTCERGGATSWATRTTLPLSHLDLIRYSRWYYRINTRSSLRSNTRKHMGSRLARVPRRDRMELPIDLERRVKNVHCDWDQTRIDIGNRTTKGTRTDSRETQTRSTRNYWVSLYPSHPLRPLDLLTLFLIPTAQKRAEAEELQDFLSKQQTKLSSQTIPSTNEEGDEDDQDVDASFAHLRVSDSKKKGKVVVRDSNDDFKGLEGEARRAQAVRGKKNLLQVSLPARWFLTYLFPFAQT